MRKLAFYLLRPFVRYHAYEHGAPGGYHGYYKLFGKIVAFVAATGDKQLSW